MRLVLILEKTLLNTKFILTSLCNSGCHDEQEESPLHATVDPVQTFWHVPIYLYVGFLRFKKENDKVYLINWLQHFQKVVLQKQSKKIAVKT